MRSIHFIAWRLRNASERSFLATAHKIGAISVALGLATSLIAFSVMLGFEQSIVKKLTHLVGHVQVMAYAPAQGRLLRRKQVEPLLQAADMPSHTAQAFAHTAVLLKSGREVEGILCRGLDLERPGAPIHHYLEAGGKTLRPVSNGYSTELLLSRPMADRLELRVGALVELHALGHPARRRMARVAGIYATHVADIDDKIAFCDLKLMQKLQGWTPDMVEGYAVFLSHPSEAVEVASQMLRRVDEDTDVRIAQEQYPAIFDWLGIVRQNAFIFTALILVVIAFNLTSVVLVQSVERTALLSFFRAMGASQQQLQRMMFYSSMGVLGRGLVWGNVIGLGVCALQSQGNFLTLDPAHYYLECVPIAWSAWVIAGVNGGVLGAAVLTTWVATAAIARLKLIQATQFR